LICSQAEKEKEKEKKNKIGKYLIAIAFS